ncbi:ABC transporter ATP-binding protein [Bradyrhizobium niftali]|jgi:branched-chain amino acid transport system ATP-binding protein|uniref:ABC transporter ATP-binding protein n=1 Tax=Bradyrhizobium niftali TaxID=2560055 RepID=A0A4Y9LXX7_9BRAD|nr:ATP-binding cassette domain-containing protein [Bradyrhizobium niftali]TFV47683.1 ABC transporter ATP-binding protein [Bradyrhizobium niftali]
MIEIDGLGVRFGGVTALNALTASLDAAVTGLVGPNGAGKTTLLNVLSGFITPTAGSVRIDGQDIGRLATHRRSAFGIRRTFQTEQVVLNLSVRDNIAGMLDHVPYGTSSRNDVINAALRYTGLSDRAHLMGGALATSDRRMVEIARCIVGAPKIIMMDEPGAGLSESESDFLRKTIVGIPAFCGAQVLLVDHDVDLISSTCSKMLVLDFGTVIAYGPVGPTLKDPKVRAAYLGETA